MHTIEKPEVRKPGVAGRITPREVLEAYEETGIIPADKAFWCVEDGNYLACAIGALMVADGTVALEDLRPEEGRYADPAIRWPRDGDRLMNEFFERRGTGSGWWGCLYRAGFMRGFDGIVTPPNIASGQERKGWRDGMRARKFVFGA